MAHCGGGTYRRPGGPPAEIQPRAPKAFDERVPPEQCAMAGRGPTARRLPDETAHARRQPASRLNQQTGRKREVRAMSRRLIRRGLLAVPLAVAMLSIGPGPTSASDGTPSAAAG